MSYKEGQQIIVPASAQLQVVPDADFPKIIDTFAGVTADNVSEI